MKPESLKVSVLEMEKSSITTFDQPITLSRMFESLELLFFCFHLYSILSFFIIPIHPGGT